VFLNVSLPSAIFFFTKVTEEPSAESEMEYHEEKHGSSLQILTSAAHSTGQGMMPSFANSHGNLTWKRRILNVAMI